MQAESHLAALTRAVNGCSQAEFESTALNLSPQERRLYEYLREHGISSTIAIRQDIAIGNVSNAAMLLNRKLERAGDSVRVACELRSHTNRFGGNGVLGWWFLTDSSGTDAAA
jgi:DNA-binding CsgD family transcriptional regulator